jgi:hypothetical protein
MFYIWKFTDSMAECRELEALVVYHEYNEQQV